ncbi:hypothetical protein BJ742DRAFT_783969 [Cladochytrium replicatum]|nr:hypothetical protein BJ742DRAFT_783969 [Cladochytrium replicatum]
MSFSGMLRRPTLTLQLLTPGPQRRFKFSKPEVHVYLKKDITNVGRAGEIILLPRSLARNRFVPLGFAYYVPKMYGIPLLPDGWKPTPKAVQVIEPIVPALYSDYDPALFLQILSDGKGESRPSTASPVQATEFETHRLLAILAGETDGAPLLSFVRQRKATDNDAIFGSVTAEDIVEGLKEVHDVVVKKGQVGFDKVKRLGVFRVEVTFDGGLDPVIFEVEVRSEE